MRRGYGDIGFRQRSGESVGSDDLNARRRDRLLVHADHFDVHAPAQVIEQRAVAASDIHHAAHGLRIGTKRTLNGGKGAEAFVNEHQVAMEDFENRALDIGRIH